MAWRLAPALAELRAEVDVRWPDRSKVSDGTIGDTRHSKLPTDHNPDRFNVVRAVDLTNWHAIGWTIAETLRLKRDPRTKYVIFEGRMFSSYAAGGVPAWTWRPYTGANKHEKHVHVSVVADARAESTAPWGLVLHHDLKNASKEDDDMTEDQEDKIDELLRLGKQILRQLGGDWDAGKWPGWPQLGGKTLVDALAENLTTTNALATDTVDELLTVVVTVRDPKTGQPQKVNLSTALTRAAEAAEARQILDGTAGARRAGNGS